ncbi:MAG: alpha/beta hydrolase [Proteobacteria bacterium]|nr:alpha/beta hydrolase [Pseudomonadota bacterium]MBU1453598.1 alpha/beta hydrolase [Pseudomonadota bacterium]
MKSKRLKGLFIPGYACTSQIWQSIHKEQDSICEATYVDWPTQMTPNFHHVDDFANWLHGSMEIEKYSFIVGHSLGGLVAFRLAEIVKRVDPIIILIETFLAPGAPFFQNLLFNDATSAHTQVIPKMLNLEKVHYSPFLRERLRHVDIRKSVIEQKKQLYAFYGDRGCGSPDRVLNELQWSDDLKAYIEVTVIPDACHFPMAENPRATLKGLKSILYS